MLFDGRLPRVSDALYTGVRACFDMGEGAVTLLPEKNYLVPECLIVEIGIYLEIPNKDVYTARI